MSAICDVMKFIIIKTTKAVPCSLRTYWIPNNKTSFRFDDDKETSALYGELWEDIPSSEKVTLQLYLPEIVSLLCDCMSSSSWAGKRKV